MSENSNTISKPLIISIICFIALINTAQLSYMAISPVPKQFGAFYPGYFVIATIASLVSISGLWLLKKWAAWFYSAILVINQMVLVSMGLWEVSAAIIPVLMIVLLFQNMDKLS